MQEGEMVVVVLHPRRRCYCRCWSCEGKSTFPKSLVSTSTMSQSKQESELKILWKNERLRLCFPKQERI
uniref:Uncharacterized protein n=1 Tax=Knipowitschia caucasica TaxID=637954 RepID=A0AAV2KN82_KNICA